MSAPQPQPMSRRRSPGLSRSLRQIMSSLSPLRAGDVVVPVRLEIGAGIDHLRVEEELIELVRHVVMVGDVLLVGLGPAVTGVRLVLDPGERARHVGRRAQEVIGGLQRLELADPLQLAPDLPARPLVGEVEDRAVLEIEQPGHIGVERRVQVRAAQKSRDHALAPDDEAHGIGRQIRRDRRAVPQLKTELEIERAVRIAQQIPEHLQPCRLACPSHAPSPFGAR